MENKSDCTQKMFLPLLPDSSIFRVVDKNMKKWILCKITCCSKDRIKDIEKAKK